MGRSGGASISVWRWWCLVLLFPVVVTQDQEAYCAPSSCGNITNISHPFRLQDDPPYCGDQRYELACENNVTVLHSSAKYHVLGINYNNFTIRLRDPHIKEADCSTYPLYSLLFNYYDERYYFPYSSDLDLLEDRVLVENIVYINCSDPVKDDAEYVDTAPCINWNSQTHIYAILGDLKAHNLKFQCRLKSFAPITAVWPSFVQNNTNLSYTDIHRVLSYGFELSWWRRACQDLPCSSHGSCYFNSSSEKLECRPLGCTTPLGFGFKTNCGNYAKLSIFAEDFLYGILEGLHQIIGKHFDHQTDYDFGLTQLGIDIGVVTARYILPYITVRFLLGVIFLSVLLIHTCRRRHLSMYEDIEDFLQLHNLMPIRYSYKQIKKMTKGFKHKLGEGGFGTVYKGKLRSGDHVAIKMLGKSKTDGREFINEVASIGRIHHVHVVRLVGFCVEGSKRALVYEFMPNGSLDKYIFSKEESVFLSYKQIHEISLGVARGITYLHHGCDMQILHFDIKPHNILLDDNFIPKVSDFGLARLYPVDDSIVTLTAARGTLGYIAPELFYKNIGGVSYKADVYSFGMLLMEMASRRRNLNPHAERSSQLYFPLWIYDQFTEEKDIEIEDLTQEEKDLAKKMLIVALWCIQLKPIDRPSMNKVVEMLEAEVESLELPPKPSLYPHESMAENHEFNSDETASNGSIPCP